MDPIAIQCLEFYLNDKEVPDTMVEGMTRRILDSDPYARKQIRAAPSDNVLILTARIEVKVSVSTAQKILKDMEAE